MALEQRDIDRQARVVYVRRALRNGRLKSTKTEGSIRAVPLQAIALAALDQLRADRESQLLFPSPRGGYFDLHNFRNRYWKPAQIAAGIVPPRRVYDLRHTFAQFKASSRLTQRLGHELLVALLHPRDRDASIRCDLCYSVIQPVQVLGRPGLLPRLGREAERELQVR
jgi:integrase